MSKYQDLVVERLVDAAEKEGCVVSVDYPWANNPVIRAMDESLEVVAAVALSFQDRYVTGAFNTRANETMTARQEDRIHFEPQEPSVVPALVRRWKERL